MKNKYVLKERESQEVKELLLETLYSDQNNNRVGVYLVQAYWKDDPKNSYIRIGYNNDGKTINFIDFDGGPLIGVGSIIEDIRVKLIVEENNNIKIVAEDVLPTDSN